ncbi:MAG: hypothetical protein AB7N76_06500 [Planctomycetota bacterium]
MNQPTSATDVQRLLVRALEDEEQRLADLEARVERLRTSKAAGTLPLPEGEAPAPDEAAGVSQGELESARQLLAESGRHLRELESRLSVLEGGDHDEHGLPREPITERAPAFLPPSAAPAIEAPRPKKPSDTDSFRAVLVTPPTEASAAGGEGLAAMLDVGQRASQAGTPSSGGFRAPVSTPPASGGFRAPATAAAPPASGGFRAPATAAAPPASGGFRAPVSAPDAAALATPRTSAGWGDEEGLRAPAAATPPASGGFRAPVGAPDAAALATPQTSAGWGEAPARDPAGEHLAAGGWGFRTPAEVPAAAELATPQTSAGWGEAPARDPAGEHLAAGGWGEERGVDRDRPTDSYGPPTTASGWADPSSELERPAARAGVANTSSFRPLSAAPGVDALATPSTSAGWGEASYTPPPLTPLHASAGPAFQAPGAVVHPPSPPPGVVVLPAPTEVINVPPPPASQGLDHSGVSQRSQAAQRSGVTGPGATGPAATGPAVTGPAVTGPAVTGSVMGGSAVSGAAPRRPVEHERFELDRAFGGREPSLKELAQGQQRILERLEALSEQVSALAYTLDDVRALRARAEAAEHACLQAGAQAQARIARLERLSASLERSAPAPAPDKEQLVALLRQVSGHHARREDSHARLRERLLRMSADHQTLVNDHAHLLEEMLGMLEEPAGEE